MEDDELDERPYEHDITSAWAHEAIENIGLSVRVDGVSILGEVIAVPGPEEDYNPGGTMKGIKSDIAEATENPEDDIFVLAPKREITCPACRGHHRRHTHDHRCRHGPREERLGERRDRPELGRRRRALLGRRRPWRRCTRGRRRMYTSTGVYELRPGPCPTKRMLVLSV